KRAYCLKTQPATGETYPKSDLFNKALCIVSVTLTGVDNAGVHIPASKEIIIRRIFFILISFLKLS
ncbi:hypothetical protein NL469_26600, partial [Klebsiella pneumoniae]|nr:hypothetical protein [Klebsiella pneumoniae]